MYKWNIPEQYANKHIGEYQFNSIDFFVFLEGVSVKIKNTPPPIIHYDMSNEVLIKYDCLPNNSLIPVINSRLKKFLELHTCGCVEFHPVLIHAQSGLLHGFYILNTIKTLPLIDLKNSEYQYIPDTKEIMGFDSVFFIKNPPHDFSIARCSEYLSYLMLSDELVAKMKKEKFKGVAYAKVMTAPNLT
ncbi:DUF1629 domain-containing protein [uncultured Citrobacter sp.]|uniref:imm11 family protein n=1 Tax=uncultured Citrobacter sp. TaxID=200446 RepID=UPI0025990C43|nr:DUF1629 domain-containing protein [uncultured Citrobacter sp.]